MSFLFGGQPKMTSEEKLANIEAQMEMVSDMYTRYVTT
jgi:import inner membrane translocase subunit TIM10